MPTIALSVTSIEDLQKDDTALALLGLPYAYISSVGRIGAHMLRGHWDRTDDETWDKCTMAFDRATALIQEKGAALPFGFAETLAHHGIDGVALLALTLVSKTRRISVIDADAGDDRHLAHMALMRTDVATVRLGDHVTWRETDLLMPAIPETMRATLVGRPLSTLVSHPALDGLDLTIARIDDCPEDRELMEVVTDAHVEQSARLAAAQEAA